MQVITILKKILFVVIFPFFFFNKRKYLKTHQFCLKWQFFFLVCVIASPTDIYKTFLFMLHVIHRNNHLLSKSSATRVTFSNSNKGPASCLKIRYTVYICTQLQIDTTKHRNIVISNPCTILHMYIKIAIF